LSDHRSLIPLVLASLFGMLAGAMAQDPATPGDPAPMAWSKSAAAYRMTLDAPRPRPLILRPDPILKWSNPVRKTDDGAVFLWNDRGRPQAIASFYRYQTVEGVSREEHEFMSLASLPVTATLDGRIVWQPTTGGIDLKPIPGAPRPASSAAARLRQMRALTNEFTAFFDVPTDHSALRILPQPLYRYELEKSHETVLDGALFAFVHTTDPEVILIIEALSTTRGAPASWHYGLARMSMVNLKVKHKGRDVWLADWDADLANPAKPYMSRGKTIAAP
jgi:hypothetical protein